MSYECERVGDTWLYLWHEHRVGFHVGQVKHSRGDLHAYVTVQSLSQNGDREGLMVAGNITLDETSPTTERMEKKLKLRDGQVPWGELLGVVCHHTRDAYNQGAPCIDLGEYELPTGAPQTLLWPTLPLNETSVYYADGGSLKSLVALAQALSIATGYELPGMREPLRTGPTLYIDYESNPEEHTRRMEWLLKGWGAPAREGGLVHYRQQVRPIADDIEELKSLRERLGVLLVVYDSAAPACGGDPKDPEPATRLMSAMREIGGTRLLIAHITGSAAERTEGSTRPFGSVFFWNLGRSLWEIQATDPREDDSRAVAMYHRKCNAGPLQRHPIVWSVSGSWIERGAIKVTAEELAAEPTLAQHTSPQYRIREALKRGAKPTWELAELLGRTEEQVEKIARRMPDLIRLPNGAWGGVGQP